MTRHYRRWLKGEKTSTNPIASIFAWTGGLKHRADLDGTPEVRHFAETLEKVIVDTVEGGQMTKDLAMLVGPDQAWLDTEGFMNALDENLSKALTAWPGGVLRRLPPPVIAAGNPSPSRPASHVPTRDAGLVRMVRLQSKVTVFA